MRAIATPDATMGLAGRLPASPEQVTIAARQPTLLLHCNISGETCLRSGAYAFARKIRAGAIVVVARVTTG
jgi:hypothetical protein